MALYQANASEGTIHATEPVTLLYPTFAVLGEGRESCRVYVAGSVCSPLETDYRRRFFVRLLRNLMQVDEADLDSDIFRRRIERFYLARHGRQQVRVALAGREFLLPRRTQRNGFFHGHVDLDRNECRQLGDCRDIDVTVRLGSQSEVRTAQGTVRLIPPTGLSVISDIDDTIKHSGVHNRPELLANTFLREFQSVPGMARLYQAWAKQNAEFHYVSSSPWQLFESLDDLRAREGFPPGTYHLRHIRLQSPTVFRLLMGSARAKVRAIVALLDTFPLRKFYLVGDSGQRDPEIYGEVARRFPKQVERIFIRRLETGRTEPRRFQHAFRGLAEQHWSLFRDPAEAGTLSG